MIKKLEKLLICVFSLVLITTFSIISLSRSGININVDDTPFSVTNLSTQDTFWPPNSTDWLEVAPETQGLDSDKIADMFDFIEQNSYDVHSVIIVRNGYLLTEEYLYNSILLDNKSYYGGETVHNQLLKA